MPYPSAGESRILPKIPVSTYRIQFNHQFTFAQAQEVIPYLNDLGITDLYASPYFKTRKGSLHGYDVVSPNEFNPEIGTEEEYNRLMAEIHRYKMGQILDIVPNHMCIATNENVWWNDVLENGPSSIYARFFDIDWRPVKKELENKVLLPILGDQYGKALENQELRLVFEEGAFALMYYAHRFPLSPNTFIDLLTYRSEDLKNRLAPDNPHLVELLSIVTALNYLPCHTETSEEKRVERHREKEIVKKRILALHRESAELQDFIDENVRVFNGTKGDPKSFDFLDALLSKQAWRLAYWRVATEEINYRRFFDINDLAAIRMEDPVVFEEAHRLVFKLIRSGDVTGLRIDHPDGLYNPSEYFTRLQQTCFVQLQLARRKIEEDEAGRVPELLDEHEKIVSSDPQYKPFYILGEKILMKGERMPEDWPIFGTIGYAFMNPLNGIFVDGQSLKNFNDIYGRFIRTKMDYQDLVYEKKKLIMQAAMSSEVNTLGNYLNMISEKNRHSRDFTLNSLRTALLETIACFPVYRTYGTRAGVNERDQRYIEQATSKAKRKNPVMSETIFTFVETMLKLLYPVDFSENDKAEVLDFAMRFQQLTGPVMAKGMEDTAFYVYNRLASLNEVGGSPDKFGTSLETFHGQNIERSKSLPHSLNATSTHDTKRGEDVRARLNVLSELPHEWGQSLMRWSRMNRRRKSKIEGRWVPDRNEEYLFYQTLVGAWPLASMGEEDEEVFRKRIKEYMLKAVREAKVNTSWINPNTPYEEALMKFVEGALSPSPANLFLKDLTPFREKIAYCGMFNSLSQTLLKIGSPGVPDFYQGTELLEFTLVDPDNRRPVDFTMRKNKLDELKNKEATPDLARRLLQDWKDGSIKLYVTYRSLIYRRSNRELFEKSTYLPLPVQGQWMDRICAFARPGGEKTLLVVVPRLLAPLVNEDHAPLGLQVWGNTEIVIPEEVRPHLGVLHNIFTGETLKAEEGRLSLGDVFASFPVALLESDKNGNK